MLRVHGLRKNFARKPVLDDVSFSVGPAEIVGIVGPNGSGKTTLLNILMDMIKPSGGSYHIDDGVKVGMSVSRKGFFDDLSVNQNLMLYAKLMDTGEDEVLEKMKAFDIDFGKIRFGKLSAGMKQRVSLLFPFVSANNLILLDEPSNHLDIDSILKLRSTIINLKQAGVSFLITSHIFSDLEKICNRILFLKNGKLVSDSLTNELLEKYGSLETAYVNILH
jgi:ABC-type multidrug transport system ATPase subunit